MSRAVIMIGSERDRQKAASWAMKAPYNCRIEFKQSKRTLPQNARLWAMLTDIARQLPWHGVKLSPDDWKLIFLDALKREMRLAPNLDGTGFVNLGRSSSDLSKSEMSDLMELMSEFGARHGVVWSDPKDAAPGEPS